jgi:CheY-like chemotaxis protein
MLSAEHDVVAVAGGREVIERIAHGERFDVILCDLMMPELTGMQVRAELVRLAPEQAEALVFMTGGAFTNDARELLAQSSNPFLEKPFEAVHLRALVRSLVPARGSSSVELD